MATTGIRDLKNNLSRYLRRVAAGERIVVTDHGRAVAELVPPSMPDRPAGASSPLAMRPPLEDGDPFADWPDPPIRLPRGTAAQLIDEDRDER